MDPLLRHQQRQSLRIIISEFIMVLAVILTVIVLVFIVSGYWLNADFEVERQGLLQLSSIPTGADVSIDDSEPSWFQRTNMSKMLSSGEHTIRVTKNGYDTWTKTANISEGLLYRIHYARLFLKERKKENISDLIGVTKAFVSEDHDTMLLYMGDLELLDISLYADSLNKTQEDLSEPAINWRLVNLNADKPEVKTITVRTLYDFFKEPKKITEKDPLKEFGFERELTESEKMSILKFYEDEYLIIADNSTITVYKKYETEPVLEASLSFVPSLTEVGHHGEFVVFSSNEKIATLDMETMSITEWNLDGDTHGWIDDDMMYSIKDGELFVYDYDGLNRRPLAENVSERFHVIITNNKWLYYFSDNYLIREQIVD